jgi:CubicO group peptidase (beta-lactamase class C family)
LAGWFCHLLWGNDLARDVEKWRRIVTPLSESGYGYGLFLINFMGHKKIGHTGRSTAGINSVAYTYPNERLTIVVLTNIAGEAPLRPLAMQVEEEIASLLLD